MYTFRNSTEEEAENNPTGPGKWIYAENASDVEYALFFGKMRRVFGENDTFSDDWENMYSYDITVEDEQGSKFYFQIYHGAGGSSISNSSENKNDENYKQAEKALIDYVESAEPIDYVWKGVYEDVPVNLIYTVKDGKAYINSDFPDDFI